jgi:hypothetical protein
VILLAAQQLAAQRSGVSAQSVLLDETGDVLVEPAPAASELDIETVLRELLRALIAVCSSPPPAIAAVAERGANGDLRGLIAELSAALIPINHSAAHRALARLFREARRADGHATEMALPPIAERSPQPVPVSAPVFAVEPSELDIDVVVEPDVAAAAPDVVAPQPPPTIEEHPLPRDLLAPDLPTRDPGMAAGGVVEAIISEPIISQRDGEDPLEPDEEPRLVLPAAGPRWTEARSDVRQLLDAFLAETRSVDHMLRVLRDMIGLDRCELPPCAARHGMDRS